MVGKDCAPGRSFVSNGPLLRCKANGQWPATPSLPAKGKEIKVEIRADISSRDPLSSIEIIKNGKLERAVPFQDWKKNGKLGPISFQESGWFLVRVIADDSRTFSLRFLGAVLRGNRPGEKGASAKLQSNLSGLGPGAGPSSAIGRRNSENRSAQDHEWPGHFGNSAAPKPMRNNHPFTELVSPDRTEMPSAQPPGPKNSTTAFVT